jgi:hypothetical protein
MSKRRRQRMRGKRKSRMIVDLMVADIIMNSPLARFVVRPRVVYSPDFRSVVIHNTEKP